MKLVKNQLVASSLCRYDTGTQAVMNCATFYDGRHHYLATGQDDECHTYSLKYKVVTHEQNKGKICEPYIFYLYIVSEYM